jgi:hypothetical protein
VGDILNKGRVESKVASVVGEDEVEDIEKGKIVDAEADVEAEAEPVKTIRMRTSSLLGDDRYKEHGGSSESLRMGARMVSAS